MAVTNKSTNRCPKVINGINGNNSIGNTKLSLYTLPPRQHHSFFRNLPPLFIYNYQKSARINNNNNNNKNYHDSQRLTKCDPPSDFGDRGDNMHTTRQHIKQNAHCSCDIYLQ